MNIRVYDTHLPDVKVVIPEVFVDERGFFMETYRQDQFQNIGLPSLFPQANHSGSEQGVLRGLHFQWEPPMGKLLRVTRGAAYLVAVDIRKGSPSLGHWYGEIVTAENRKQIWAPAGFARGLYVISEYAEIQYLCSAIYNAAGESSIRWNDADININWNIKGRCILSARDSSAQSLVDWLSRPESAALAYGRHGA